MQFSFQVKIFWHWFIVFWLERVNISWRIIGAVITRALLQRFVKHTVAQSPVQRLNCRAYTIFAGLPVDRHLSRHQKSIYAHQIFKERSPYVIQATFTSWYSMFLQVFQTLTSGDLKWPLTFKHVMCSFGMSENNLERKDLQESTFSKLLAVVAGYNFGPIETTLPLMWQTVVYYYC